MSVGVGRAVRPGDIAGDGGIGASGSAAAYAADDSELSLSLRESSACQFTSRKKG